MKEQFTIDHAPFTVKPGKKFRLKDHDTAYTADIRNKKEAREALFEDVTELAEAQELLWASGQKSVLIIFQAMDAAGKDGTIKHVMSGINPQGCDVYSFKAPCEDEKKHHFLWRPMKVLPAAGRIAIFNRSYYEEVLVVRVHPEFLRGQVLHRQPRGKNLMPVWKARYRQINEFERYMSANGTCIIKFFLNVSREEQKQRFLQRLDDDKKHWKFSAADVREREYWDDYQQAYEDMLKATSTEHAPWYVIPADKKWFARALVADIITSRIKELKLKFPKVSKEQLEALQEAKAQLEAEDS
jgi:PPK2 family polyphosphate:nucleotide phosphotransferase